MIIKELLQNSELLESFDFDRDYRDTLQWLRSIKEDQARTVRMELSKRAMRHFGKKLTRSVLDGSLDNSLDALRSITGGEPRTKQERIVNPDNN